MSNYGKNSDAIAAVLRTEIMDLMSLNPDCIIICCNSLHKYYDLIKHDLYPKKNIPVFHAVQLTAQHIKQLGLRKVLLLATKSTMEDGFFAKTLEAQGIEVVIPQLSQRDAMQKILSEELIHNIVTPNSRDYFASLITDHPDCQAVVLGCTEFPLLVDNNNSTLPIINPIILQCTAAVDFALK